MLVVPRAGLSTSRVLGDEVKVIVCPAFADSISEGDVRSGLDGWIDRLIYRLIDRIIDLWIDSLIH